MIFLDDDWVAAVDTALAALDPAETGSPAGSGSPAESGSLTEGEGPLSIEYRVEGGPQGPRCHRLVLSPGGIRIGRPGGAGAGLDGEATMTMTMGWEVAVAVNQGTLSAQAAVLDGRITVAGDPAPLLPHQARLAAVDDVLASIRADTITSP